MGSIAVLQNPNAPQQPYPTVSLTALSQGTLPSDQQSAQSAQPSQSSNQIDPSTGLPIPATQQPGVAPGQTSPYQPLALPQADPGQGIQLQPEQQQGPLGAVTHAGAAAYIADKLLRGAITGSQQAQQAKAAQLNRTLAAQKSIYEDQAQQLRQLAASGTDPNSQEFQDAMTRVKSAHDAMLQTIGSQIPPPKLDKNGKPKDGDGRNLLQRMLNPQDPTAALQAWYTAAKQLGPPVYHDIAPMLTQQYQAKVQQQAQIAGIQAGTAQTNAQQQSQTASLENERLHLIGQPSLTPEQQDRLDSLNVALGKPGTGLKNAIDQQAQAIRNNPLYSQDQKIKMLEALQSKIPASLAVPFYTWGKDEKGKAYRVGMDKATNQETTARDYNVPVPASIAGVLRSLTNITTHVNPDGSTFQIKNSSTSQSAPAGNAGVGAGNPSTALGNDNEQPTVQPQQATPTTPTTSAPTSTAPHRGRDRAAEAAAAQASSSGSSQPSVDPDFAATHPGVMSGAPQPKLTPPVAKATEDYTNATKLVSLAQQLLQAPGPINQSTSQYLLLDQMVHGALGRANQQAINNALHTIGWKDSAENWLNSIQTGGVSPVLVRQLAQYAQQNLRASDTALKAAQAQTGNWRGARPHGKTPSPPASTDQFDWNAHPKAQ